MMIKRFHAWRSSASIPEAERALSWEASRETLARMVNDDFANGAAVEAAAALIHALAERSQGHAPVLSLDPDGDVVLTWHRGALKASAIVGESSVSSVVTSGRRIAHIGDPQPLSHLFAERSEIASFEGSIEWNRVGRMDEDASMTGSRSGASYFYRQPGTSTPPSRALSATPASSSSSPTRQIPG